MTLSDLAVNLLVCGLVLWALWLWVRPHYIFVVRVKGGTPRLSRGKATAAFLGSVGEACRLNQVTRGWVGGVRRGRNVALVFSRHIPPGCQQQLRNAWLQSG